MIRGGHSAVNGVALVGGQFGVALVGGHLRSKSISMMKRLTAGSADTRPAEALQCAVHQHQDETMRVGGGNPTVGRDTLVRGERRSARICVHAPVAARSGGTLGGLERG